MQRDVHSVEVPWLDRLPIVQLDPDEGAPVAYRTLEEVLGVPVVVALVLRSVPVAQPDLDAHARSGARVVDRHGRLGVAKEPAR